jgi:peptidoglycan/xylan/chitin deacetylase (PgdA/CDA1 family)
MYKIPLLSFLLIIFALVLPSIVSAKTPSIPILMYHYIQSSPAHSSLFVSPQNFASQMAYLADNGFTPISLDTLYAINQNLVFPPQKPIVITFDDGYIDFYTNAFPILRRYNFNSTVFVITGFVGRPPYLSWNNIEELNRTGLVSFQSHSVNHKSLTSLVFAKITQELTESKSVLGLKLGHPVNFIAYPFGQSDPRVASIASRAGYSGGLTTIYGKSHGNSFSIPRIRISGFDSLAAFAAKIN